MKKNGLILLGILILLLVLVFIISRLYNQRLDIDPDKIQYIKYSYGGGFGREVDVATKTITINNNYIVEFANSYNDEIIETFEIDKDSYDELCLYIILYSNVFINKPKENKDVTDMNSSYITIKTMDNEYTTGGYAISNHEYNKIVNKIIDVVGKDKFNNYVNSIE